MIFFVTLKLLIVSMLAGRVVAAGSPPTFQIHPNGNKNKCLDVRGAAFENNTPVNMSAIFSKPRHLHDTNWLINFFLDTIAMVLALKTGGFSMGRRRSDWRAPIFVSTLEPVRANFVLSDRSMRPTHDQKKHRSK